MDINGHGTQVTGVIVAGNGIGMAPGARFIAARAFDDSGASTASAIHASFQWLLDPDGDPATNDAPNVVNISWGARQGCNLEFQPDLQALRAAHIVPVAAAGNDGSIAAADNSPANLPEAFAVGATIDATTIAPFSSVGPSSCGGQFPALVAPGEGIRSTGIGGSRRDRPRGHLVLGAARRGRARAAAAGLPAADRNPAGEPAHAERRRPRRAGSRSTFGAGFLDVIASRAAAAVCPRSTSTRRRCRARSETDTTLQLRANDALSAIAGGEWWADADPGIGAGQPFTAADGAFDSHSEGLVASLAALAPGPHLLGMRARDAAGNWSTATSSCSASPLRRRCRRPCPRCPSRPPSPVAPAPPPPASLARWVASRT